jgi:hypothetical protein
MSTPDEKRELVMLKRQMVIHGDGKCFALVVNAGVLMEEDYL